MNLYQMKPRRQVYMAILLFALFLLPNMVTYLLFDYETETQTIVTYGPTGHYWQYQLGSLIMLGTIIPLIALFVWLGIMVGIRDCLFYFEQEGS